MAQYIHCGSNNNLQKKEVIILKKSDYYILIAPSSAQFKFQFIHMVVVVEHEQPSPAQQ
jgi:hypothetical protein